MSVCAVYMVDIYARKKSEDRNTLRFLRVIVVYTTLHTYIYCKQPFPVSLSVVLVAFSTQVSNNGQEITAFFRDANCYFLQVGEKKTNAEYLTWPNGTQLQLGTYPRRIMFFYTCADHYVDIVFFFV